MIVGCPYLCDLPETVLGVHAIVNRPSTLAIVRVRLATEISKAIIIINDQKVVLCDCQINKTVQELFFFYLFQLLLYFIGFRCLV